MSNIHPLPKSWEPMVTEMTFTLVTPLGTINYVLDENTSISPDGVGDLVESLAEAIWPSGDAA